PSPPPSHWGQGGGSRLMDPQRSPGLAGKRDLFIHDTHANRGVEPRVVHSSRGRLRIALPLWVGKAERQIESQLVQLPGVHAVEANALTGNILFRYDATLTSARTLLAEVKT